MNYDTFFSTMIETLNKNQLNLKFLDYIITDLLNITEIDKLNNKQITKLELKKCNNAINKLINNEPIQYIVGKTDFYGNNFKVSKSVLIPRFETEELVNNTINYIKNNFDKDISLVDIGTGSGAIGLTIKKELPYCDVTITDISSRALKVAEQNAINLNLNVKFKRGNMLDPLLEEPKKYNILISNPPYIKTDEEIMDIVKKEPKKALYAGKDGLKFYKRILKNADKILTPKSLIALEIGSSQSKDIILLIKKHFKNSKYEIKKDLQGRDRMVFIYNNIEK